jgi:hypothetical protein
MKSVMGTRAWLVGALLGVAGLGCGGTTMGADGGSDVVATGDTGTTPDDAATTPTATWTEVYAVISSRCMLCHSGGMPSGGLNMSSKPLAYQNLVGVAAAGSSCAGMGTRVVASDPDGSLLFRKVSEMMPGCGGRMPLGGPYLSSANVTLIRDWIAAGAMDN